MRVSIGVFVTLSHVFRKNAGRECYMWLRREPTRRDYERQQIARPRCLAARLETIVRFSTDGADKNCSIADGCALPYFE
jgi:hypothetical protein